MLYVSDALAQILFVGIVAYSRLWWDMTNLVAKKRVCTPKYQFYFVLQRECLVIDIHDKQHRRVVQHRRDLRRLRKLQRKHWGACWFTEKDVTERLRKCIQEIENMVAVNH